ncbi:hypothetical protein [Nocardioides taihuensis]|uniref:DUF418 domain-containing protein n=1 Tax=Nocardioides taihuensis TaxID=1835606 RepID=A0ABW0BNQ9_9ACTN
MITIVGIAVTLVGYFGQHGLTRLRQLEPDLFAWWNRSWWVRRVRASGAITRRPFDCWSSL